MVFKPPQERPWVYTCQSREEGDDPHRYIPDVCARDKLEDTRVTTALTKRDPFRNNGYDQHYYGVRHGRRRSRNTFEAESTILGGLPPLGSSAARPHSTVLE